MPKFSVIIANHNYAEFISAAIKSVLQQSFQDFELIVVDDGSSDDSLEQIHLSSGPKLTVIVKSNGGQASAFNAGFEASKGEVLCFLDSDDWWSLNKLQVLDSWDEFLGRDYALMQHQLVVTDGEHETPYRNILPSGDCFAEMCATGNIDYFVPTSGLAIPRTVCERIFPIPQQLRICADAFLTRAAFTFGNVISIPKSLAFYRKHNNLVFNNPDFRREQYFDSTLFPSLHEFYRVNNIASNRFSPEWPHARQGLLSRVNSLLRSARRR